MKIKGKFKVGDKVKVLEYEEIRKLGKHTNTRSKDLFLSFTINQDKRNTCGKEFTIMRIIETAYRINTDSFFGDSYTVGYNLKGPGEHRVYTDKMLKRVKQNEV